MPNSLTAPMHGAPNSGVSVVICCHNSETLLPTTITHLKNQRVEGDLKWEVLVIDNASTDNTALVARQCWGDHGPTPLRVVQETRLGLAYARERAFDEARYDILSFIDDDNWVTPHWVTTAWQCMSEDLQLGAVGSANTAVADVALPDWFVRYSNYYAVWDFPPDATIATSFLAGAGMTIRKSVWHWLKNHGFHSQLTGRLGTKLSSSEDVELGCAILLAGWKIRVEPRLELRHHMIPHRLRWDYLRRLIRGVGESDVVLDSYFLVAQAQSSRLLDVLRQCWWLRLAKETMQLIYSYPSTKLLGCPFRSMEGDDDVAQIEFRTGRLLGLLRLRSKYGRLRREIARAVWRRFDAVDSFFPQVEGVGQGLRCNRVAE
jgi:glycosyltransferase involved in cell wall biosynthesis